MRGRRGTILALCAAAGLSGCGLLQDLELIVGTFITPPAANMTPVVGGLNDLRPYLGTYKYTNVDSDEGVFLLGSCGCGDWRVLFQSNGGQKKQFPVQFYTDGQYTGSGPVVAYGLDGDDEVLLDIDQTGGALDGLNRSGYLRKTIDAARGEDGHGGGSVDACILCHLGEDPIYPLPDYHPPKYKTNPRVCLECHSANGS